MPLDVTHAVFANSLVVGWEKLRIRLPVVAVIAAHLAAFALRPQV
jgi:hypothetical protein